MCRTILLLGESSLAPYAIRSSKRLGCSLKALTRSGAFEFPIDGVYAGPINEADHIVEVARKAHAQAVFPLVPEALPAALVVAEEQGIDLTALSLLAQICDKGNLRNTLDTAGVATPPSQMASTMEEAEHAVHLLGVPLFLWPGLCSLASSPRLLEYREDLPLVFGQVQRQAANGVVLIEPAPQGTEFGVDLILREGTPVVASVSGIVRDRNAPQVPVAVYLPIEPEGSMQLVDTAVRALHALGCPNGIAHVDILEKGDGKPLVTDVGPPWGNSPVLLDVIHAALGVDMLADIFRLLLGDDMKESANQSLGAAAVWLESRSGVVESIDGEAEVRAMPGVKEVVVNVQQGDVLGHVVDTWSRDRLGYVLASGSTAQSALDTAYSAQSRIMIHTRPTR